MIKKLQTKMLLPACFAATMLTANAQTGLHFDGVDDYVQGTTIPVSGNGARTIEAWIRTTKDSNGNQSVICDWGHSSTWTTGNRFTFNILWSNTLRLEVAGGGINGNTAVNDGLWHHVAVTFNNSATYKVKLYVDGVLDAEGNMGNNPTVNTATNTKLRLGMRVDGVNLFEGDMDEVRVWDYALTEAELQSRMNVELCGDEAGLVAYFPLTEGTPGVDNTGITTTSDMSPTNDTGTLNNFALTGDTSNWVEGHGLVSLSETTLTAAQTGATYQWVDCDNDNAVLDGATAQTFTPEASGNYAVEITVDGCVTTSGCMAVEVESLGVEDTLFANNLKVYPNPTSGNVKVILNGVYETVDAQLVSITGKVVAQYQFSNTNEFAIDLNNINSGLYFLNLKADQLDAATVKVVKM
ncbi:LamG-like jellyroll fold domain-containing protein [Mangrovimonas sp. YM274]|uniref:LamG-like jellyroll fold domain-containing protein n=1 Tax=Mangrovimonas sp. YM274 TaxID=3070660 RepID=UPI0027DB119D|nr:LamG-like jellyroll fold domain-containing protein [Mangrovimonas sp. YM274]WMI70224.1 LamG-like jellyroll fold domain-containing protein [Mangrovimonas sp. YM274]